MIDGGQGMCRTLAELGAHPPGMAVADVLLDGYFNWGHGMRQKMVAGSTLVMSQHRFQALEFADPGKQVPLLRRSEVSFESVWRPYRGEGLDGKQLLVWRDGGIGDVLFLQPCVRWLKTRWPSSRIVFGTSKHIVPLVEGWGCVDEVVTNPFPLALMQASDYHISVEGVIERCEEARTKNAYRLFSDWTRADVPDDDLRPRLVVDRKADVKAASALRHAKLWGKPYLYFQLRASSKVRTPPLKMMVVLMLLAMRRGFEVVVGDSPDKQASTCAALAAALNEERLKHVHVLCKHMENIQVCAAFVARASGVVAPDSSAPHLAGGFDVPVFGVFAPFPGWARLSTYKDAWWTEPAGGPVCPHDGKACHLHAPVCPWAVDFVPPCFRTIDPDAMVGQFELFLAAASRLEVAQPCP